MFIETKGFFQLDKISELLCKINFITWDERDREREKGRQETDRDRRRNILEDCFYKLTMLEFLHIPEIYKLCIDFYNWF